MRKPVLLVDIDGVLSLWGFDLDKRPDGTWHQVEGIAHFLSSTAVEHLHDLAESFDLVWCSGWEEKADEYLPHTLGLPAGRPHLVFGPPVHGKGRHWKLVDSIQLMV